MERFEGPSSSRTLVATTDYAHDSAGRLVSLDHSQGANAIAGYTYGYDTLGRLESFGSLADGSVTYAYDQTSQLTAATGSGTLPDESYRYDGSGNREGSTYHTGTANRVSFDAKYNYQYDNEGNRIRRIERVSGEVTRYHWDHRNRLVMQEHRSETEQLLWRERYSYDGLNRRVERVGDSDGDGVNEQSEYFVNHGLRSDRGGAGDSIALRLDGTGAVIGRELHGPTVDSILAEDRLDPEGGATETLWALTDANGSVRDTVGVDDAGTATIGNHVAYDAFGQMVTQSDASSGSEYGFTGREIESGGLQSNRARIYDAALGRWLSEDPIGFASGQTNLSLYLGNDPISGTDPSGLIDPRNFHPMQEFRVFWAGVYKSFLGGNASPVPGKRITHPHGVGGVVGGVVRYGSLGAASSLTEPAGTRSSYSQSGMELSELPMSFTPLASGYHVLHGESAAGASRNRALAGAELGTWVVGTALGLRQVGRSAGLQRAPVAPNRVVDSVTGRLGGELYDSGRLAKLNNYLERRGVALKVGDEFLPPGKGGGFLAKQDGSAELILRSNPTQYEVWHELGHFRHWRNVGPDRYRGLQRWSRANPVQDIHEQHVFDLLENGRHWDLLNDGQRRHAVDYIYDRGGIR